MTTGPFAVRTPDVAGGATVVVVAGADVADGVVRDGLVDDPDRVVVVLARDVVVVDCFVGAEGVAAPVTAPRLILTGLVWKPSTDAKPTTVPTATMGERFTRVGVRQVTWWTLFLEGEGLVMQALVGDTEALHGADDDVGETARSAHEDVVGVNSGYQ